MKTAEEILNKEWDNYRLNGKSFKQIAIEAMKEYAKQIAKQALKDANDRASYIRIGKSVSINPCSILNTPIITP